MNKLLGIIGPTGVGKTELAIRIAHAFQAEIIGCDSRQVYRYMDIGTAKPSLEECLSVPYHMVDIINPDQILSLAKYRDMAYNIIHNVQTQGKLPVLTGGTGQYFWAVVEGWEMPRVAPDIEVRNRLEQTALEKGADVLYGELQRVDPEAAKKIDPHNIRRIIRALEVYHNLGVPPSQIRRKKPFPFDTLIIGLTMERSELYRRVDARIEKMINNGWIEEVQKLLNMGYDFNLPAMSGIGYKEIGQFLKNEMTLEVAVQRIKYETHRFIRQQYTWFRLKDERINWYDVTGTFDEKEIINRIAGFL